MNTTAYTGAEGTFEEPTFGDEVSEFMPWVFGAVLIVPIAFLSLVLWAPFLLLFVLVAAPVAAVGILGAVAASLVMAFLFLRDRYRHFAERRSAKRSHATSGVLASAGGHS
ncbi:MAG TPA: hypothetical protein VF066_18590 [Thermoleophilaceae bacterium]